MSFRARVAAFTVDRGGAVALAALVLYVWLAPAYIVDGDNAEFSTLGTTGGVAHPPGYPLYLIVLRALSWLPAESPAHAAALATGIIGALAVLVLHAACRAWGARPTAASVAAALFASGPIVLRFHSEAEAFALNNLVVATVLWLAAAAGPLRGTARIATLALVAGLGMSNHLTCVLIAPVGLLGVARGVRETTGSRPIALVRAVFAFAIGLVPYLYLWATPTTPASWTTIDSFGALLHHFLREDYGGPGAFAPRGEPVSVFDNLLALAQTLGRSGLWLVPALGVVWLCLLVGRRTVRLEPRGGWWALALSFLAAGPLLAIKFNKQLDADGLYVVTRFHMLPLLLLAVPSAVAIEELGTALLARARAGRLRSQVAGAILAVGVLATGAAVSLPSVTTAYSPAAQRSIENLLRTMPPRAVVIGSFDLLSFGAGYVQDALGQRTDVSVVMWPTTRATFLRRTGVSIAHVASDPSATVRVAEAVLASGRPLFADESTASRLSALPSYPYGLVFRILPAGTTAPDTEQVFAMNKELVDKLVIDYPVPRIGDGVPADVHAWYARMWRILATALAAGGRRDDAAFALEMERTLAPRL